MYTEVAAESKKGINALVVKRLKNSHFELISCFKERIQGFGVREREKEKGRGERDTQKKEQIGEREGQ